MGRSALRYRELVTALAATVAMVGASCSSDDSPGSGDEDADPPVRATTTTGVTTTDADPEPPPPTTRPGTTGPPRSTEVPSTTPPPTVATLGEPETDATPVGPPRGGLVDLAPAAGGRLYQVFQSGAIELTDSAGGDAEVVLDIGDVTEASGEQGLLGLAIAPDGELAYINYTDATADGTTVIAEYTVNDDGTFDAASARTVLSIEQPYSNHNGGDVTFGPDGYLYVATGDGGAGNDPERRALDLSSLLGKILRIDPSGAGDGGEGGTGALAPADNPFVDDSDARDEIWSYGLRNPWRLSFDEPTGDLWIADVGQSDIEEIDVARADDDGRNAGRGTNFGWSAFEGPNELNDDQLDLVENHVAPIYTYENDGDRCSVSGAASYHGDRIPELAGGFVFADYCSGEVWAIPVDGAEGVVDLGTVPDPTAVREVHGELYVVSLTEGLFRLDPA